MKSEQIGSNLSSNEQSRKLMSLLALAAGAVAMPQTSNADVIFTNLTSAPVTIGPAGTNSFLIDNLPGTAEIQFNLNQGIRPPNVASSRWVTAKQFGGYVRFKTSNAFALPLGAGRAWNTIQATPSKPGIGSSNVGTIGRAFLNNPAQPNPASFDHEYLAFEFKDSTQPDSPLRYGWIELSLSNPSDGTGPNVTILGYAFDTSGNMLVTGSLGVPEPAPGTLLALGALVLGAKGVRAWRRNRQSTTES